MQNEEKIRAAIAAYLEKETIHDYISERENVKFGGTLNPGHFTHAGFCQEIAAEILSAIRPHLEAGLHDPSEKPQQVKDEYFSVDVIVIDENGMTGLAFWNFDDNAWMFHTDTVVDYNEPGNETKWKWYYPAIEKI